MAPRTRNRPRGDDPPFDPRDTNQDGRIDDNDEQPGPELDNGPDVVAYLQELGPTEGVAWLEEHADELGENAAYEVDAFIGGAGDEWQPAAPAATGAADEADQGNIVPGTATYDEAREEAAAAQAEYLAGLDPGVAPEESTLQGIIDEHLPYESIPDAEREAFIDSVTQDAREQAIIIRQRQHQNEGMDEASAGAVAADEVDQTLNLYGSNTPPWLQEIAGGDLTPQEKDRYLDYWNDDHGTNFTNFDRDLVPVLEQMGQTDYTQNMTNAVLADQEPLITHSIELPLVGGTRRITASEDEMQALRDMGFGNDSITRLIRLAGVTAGPDAIAPGAAFDGLPVAPLAGLVRYFGGGQEFADYNQRQQQVAELEQTMGLRPGAFARMTYEERVEMRKRWETTLEGTPLSERPDNPVGQRIEAWDQAEQLLRQQGRREESGRVVGILGANNMYQRGIETYNGDPVLAFISAVDPRLAERISSTGGDMSKLDGQDNVTALQIMDRGGLINRGSTFFERAGGGPIGDSVMRYLSYFDVGAGAGGGGGGGAGPVRRVLDPAAVREQTQKMFSQFLLEDVPDEVSSSIYNWLQGQLDATTPGQDFDWSARIMDFIRDRPQYAELYGNKPDGMDDMEYQAQFNAGVQGQLGPEADLNAVRAGMRTGNYQAAVGVAAIGGLAGDNSHLLGKWAGSKQVLDRFT